MDSKPASCFKGRLKFCCVTSQEIPHSWIIRPSVRLSICLSDVFSHSPRSAFSSQAYTCPPKQGQWRPAKVWSFLQAQEDKIILGGGRGTELGHRFVVGVLCVREAVGCGDWDNSHGSS